MPTTTKKPKAKTPAKNTARVVAIKTARNRQQFMPDTVFVSLDGEPGPRGAFDVLGWSLEPDAKAWSIERLEDQLKQIKREWSEVWGAAWKLQITIQPRLP